MNLDQVIRSSTDVDPRDHLYSYLEQAFKDKRIYHPSGRNGLVVVNPGRLGPKHQRAKDTHVLHNRLNTLFGGDLFAEPLEGAPTEHYAVIATGISGAGKTTVMREILSMFSGSGYSEAQEAITKLEKSMVIADALGDAKTMNNDDSSRMISNIGRDPQFIVSAMMLEYTRLHRLRPSWTTDRTEQSSATDGTERSFHVFYYLLAHGHPALSPDIIQQMYPQAVRMKDDTEGYERVDSAMRVVAGDQDQQLSTLTWNGLAGIALLMTAKNGNDPKAKLGFELVRYWEGLSLPKGTTQSDEAERDELYNLGKAIYRLIFEFWTGKASRVCKTPGEKGRTVVIFDICGFESLERNRLAQLLVNDFYEKILATQVDDIAAAFASQGSPNTVNGSSCEQTSGHFLIDKISTCRTSDDIDEALSAANAQDKTRIKIKGRRGNFKLFIKHLTEAVEVEYDHTSFLSDNEDVRRRRFLERCEGLAPFLLPTPSNGLLRHSAITSMLNDWRTAQSVLGRAHLLVINCIKASGSLDPWVFDDQQEGVEAKSDRRQGVKAQITNLAIIQTNNLMRSVQMEKEDTKANFASRYACLLPEPLPATSFIGQAERVHKIVVCVMDWLTHRDDGVWGESYVLLANKVYYSQTLADRLDELVKAHHEQHNGLKEAPTYKFHADEEKDQEIRATVTAALEWYRPNERPSDKHVSEIFDLVIDPLVQHLGDCTMVSPNTLLQTLLRDTIVSEAQLRLVAASDSDLGIAIWNQFSSRLVALAEDRKGTMNVRAPRGVIYGSTGSGLSLLNQQQECLTACLQNACNALLVQPSLVPDQSDWMKTELWLLVGRLSRA